MMDNMWLDGAMQAIKAIAFVCDIITYPVYLLLQRPWERKRLSRRPKAKVVARADRSVTYRSLSSIGEIHARMLASRVDTMDKMLQHVLHRFHDKKCLGTRDILAEEDEVQPNGRIFKKYVMGEYKWLTYSDLNKSAIDFGRGLRELGHQPHKNIAIFAETRAEWLIVAHACFKQNFPLVTLYATLGEDAIAHGINETEVTIVVTTHDLLPKIKNILPKTPLVATVIFMEDQLHPTDTVTDRPEVTIMPFKQVLQHGRKSSIGKSSKDQTKSSENSRRYKRVNFIPFKQVLQLGQKSLIEGVPPTKDDIAIIMYTSGSTGVPKGVVITHSNMMATMGAFSDAVTINDDDVFLGFLPLAHVFELLTESVCLLFGVPIGYSTPLTMIDTSSKIKRGTKGDASVLHPTCLTAVPLILDRIYKGVNEKLSKASPIKKAVFDFAFNYKRTWMKRGFSTPLLDKMVFAQTRQLLGGRVRMVLCGGAPLSPDTHELIKVCLCEGVISGYGLTETTSCATIMDINDRSRGRAGGPATVCEMRLIDWEEGKYRVTDKPFPRGEIVIGGDNISPGYYQNPEKTKEDFFEEDGKRWFRTGDIGEIHEDGVLKIIDRKKDLVKLQAGEYVSLGKVEAELKTCPLVENICVYCESTKDHTVALLVPNPGQLATLAASIGKSADLTFEQLCADRDVEDAVIKALAAHGKKSNLEKFEIPTAVKLCTEVWSPDMGLVTAAFKLKRKDIQERYQHEINRMYSS